MTMKSHSDVFPVHLSTQFASNRTQSSINFPLNRSLRRTFLLSRELFALNQRQITLTRRRRSISIHATYPKVNIMSMVVGPSSNPFTVNCSNSLTTICVSRRTNSIISSTILSVRWSLPAPSYKLDTLVYPNPQTNCTSELKLRKLIYFKLIQLDGKFIINSINGRWSSSSSPHRPRRTSS